MQIGMNGHLSRMSGTDAAGQKSRRFATEEWILKLAEAGKKETVKEGQRGGMTVRTEGERQPEHGKEQTEAAKIYEAAMGGKENPVYNIRQASKVPYGYLAKDGVIEYNGVCFICDEKTNSICLGDVSNPKEIITVALSDGGYLKVNRDNLGELADAAGMFSPEDLNRIMRAIAQDTKIQSMQKEIEDMEGSAGSKLSAENRAVQDGQGQADTEK